MLCSEIQIRDPYVVLLDGKYYLYGTTGNNCWGKGYGFDAYKEEYCDMVSAGIIDPAKVTRSALENAASDDLMHFDGPFPIFRPRPGFWADKNF